MPRCKGISGLEGLECLRYPTGPPKCLFENGTTQACTPIVTSFHSDLLLAAYTFWMTAFMYVLLFALWRQKRNAGFSLLDDVEAFLPTGESKERDKLASSFFRGSSGKPAGRQVGHPWILATFSGEPFPGSFAYSYGRIIVSTV